LLIYDHVAMEKHYGIAEIAEALGARRQTVAQRFYSGGLPEPDQRLKMGPVWHAATIEPWIKAEQKKRRKEAGRR
jgi:hypothetical protein